MEVIGLILLILLVFIIFGVLGWFLKLIEFVFEGLFDGCCESCGCIIVIFIVILVLVAL